MKKLRCNKVVALFLLTLPIMPVAVTGQTKVISESLSGFIPENSILSQRSGIWDVTETVWPFPGAAPVTTEGLVAERKMIGSLLEELIWDSAQKEVKRTDLLTYNRIEGRWDYVSFDARAPLGLMDAWSSVKGDGKTIELSFYPFALPGTGNSVSGQMLRMDQTITYSGPDHDEKDQYFMFADGTATRYLAHRYTYARRLSRKVIVPPAGKSSRIDEIRKRGTLRVAVLDEYPWLKANPKSSPKPFGGPAWILAEEYANRLGVRLEIVPVVFDSKILVLKTGKADLTIAPLLATPQRMKDVDMINYSVSAQTLFGKKDNPKLKGVTSIDELNQPEITVAFIDGSPQGKWLSERLPNAAKFPVKGNLAGVALDPVLNGKADITNIDKFFFTGLAEKNPGLISIPKDFMSSEELPLPIGMAIEKGQTVFLDWLRAVADEIKSKVKASETAVIETKN